MGLNCSHNAWNGGYISFMRWRSKLSKIAGLPPLELMEGFYNPLNGRNLPTLYHGVDTGKPPFGDKSRPFFVDIDSQLPIRWDCLSPSPLYELLNHSDCDGSIKSGNCEDIAYKLEELKQLLPDEDAGGHIGNWKQKTQQFIDGLRLAAAAKEDLEFH